MKMTKAIGTTGIIAVGLFAVACGDDDEPPDQITTDANPSADFTEFETFAFTTPSEMSPNVVQDIPENVSVNLTLVNDEIRDELRELGLTEVSVSENPDLRVTSLASTQDEESVYWECSDSYWYGYWYWTWAPCAFIEPVYTEYTEGSILIGLVDPNTEELVFGGLIQGVVDDSLSSAEVAERIDEDVDRVFDAYPRNQTGN